VYGPESLPRFNMFTAVAVNGMPADGYSSGDAIKAVQEVAEQTLPAGYGYEFSGMTREESQSSSSTVVIFVICIIFIYLILCALYESVFIPLAVILSVPFGLMGSFLFAKMFGLENNIYMQTGLIMLIGLLAKTAILLTEFASERRYHGMGIVEAALSASTVRLRPILMTALTMIFGLFPMMFATGVGANGNISLGVGAVGGMFIGTLSLLFIVPILFVVFQRIQEKLMPARKLDEISEK
ncbi:MAG: efflux RND transporter permease subunit, partial [Bacteroidales bacterium]